MVTAVVVAVLRLRRPSSARRPVAVPEPTRAEVASKVEAWPPAPILGTPDTKILRGYATPARLPGFLTRRPAPRPPLDRATRRFLTRWGAVACALCLLAVGAQFLESTVFSGRGHAGKPVVGRVPEVQETPAPVVLDADCHPAARRPHLRARNPKVTRAVNRQWVRIERWLRVNAPRTYGTLAAPARPGTIAVAEAQMGLRLPEDLRASLLRHNGGGVSLLGEDPLDVRRIRDSWRMLCEVDGTDDHLADETDERSEWWDGRMIPFTADGTGCYLLVDSVVRDVGRSCEDSPIGFAPGGVRVKSYYALLKATADALETGGRIGYWRPRVVEGVLDWDVVGSP